MIAITPPCERCGHTRTLHERQWRDASNPCLFDWCLCSGYVSKRSNHMYVWINVEIVA